ncbi:MAG: hypothetical protein V1659_05855 [Candidatus Woesearchaeota archaeon]
MVLKKFVCEICGNAYDTKDEARKCEAVKPLTNLPNGTLCTPMGRGRKSSDPKEILRISDDGFRGRKPNKVNHTVEYPGDIYSISHQSDWPNILFAEHVTCTGVDVSPDGIATATNVGKKFRILSKEKAEYICDRLHIN